MTTLAPAKDFTASIEARLAPQLAQGPAWLVEARQQALARFLDLGLPTKRLEAWKYTDVTPIAKGEFTVATAPDRPLLAEVQARLATQPAGLRLVLVDGHVAAELSTLDGLPTGVTVESFAAVLNTEPNRLQGLLHHAAQLPGRDDAFTALNLAGLADGVLVSLAKNAVLDQPLHLEVVTSAGTMAQVRVLIQAAANSQIQVIETHHVLDGAASFSNAVTEILAGDNAQVTHYLVEPANDSLYHVGAVYADQGPNSQVTSYTVSLGGPLWRNALHVHQGASGASVVQNGLFLADGKQHVDNQLTVDHAAPHGHSDQLYKGILDGAAVGVFNGRVIVRAGAAKTDSAQMNKNLLLSPTAIIDTKPHLEIDTDDVACTHGTTVGQIDEDALFYLRSRGIDEAEARTLITVAFASDVVDRIPIDSLRDQLNHWLFHRLTHGQSQEVTA